MNQRNYEPHKLKMKGSPSTAIWVAINTALVIAIGILDWWTGYELDFFVFYFIPIAITAWKVSLRASVVLSILAAIVWEIAVYTSGYNSTSIIFPIWDTLIHLISFFVIGWAVFQKRELIANLQKTTDALKLAMSEIQVLGKFLPICAYCKKIRNKEGNWQQMEQYISEHSETKFSHGYCPECAEKTLKEAGL
jgi:hypothetical protein